MRDKVKNLLENNVITDVWLSSESMWLTLADGNAVEVKAHDINWLTYKVWRWKEDKK